MCIVLLCRNKLKTRGSHVLLYCLLIYVNVWYTQTQTHTDAHRICRYFLSDILSSVHQLHDNSIQTDYYSFITKRMWSRSISMVSIQYTKFSSVLNFTISVPSRLREYRGFSVSKGLHAASIFVTPFTNCFCATEGIRCLLYAFTHGRALDPLISCPML